MSETWSPDILFGGSTIRPLPEAITVADGEDLERGAALGKILYDVGDVTAGDGDTGDGTCVVALPADGVAPALGDYTLNCEVIADAGPPAVVAQFRFVTPRTPQGVLVLADGNPAVVDGVQVTLTEGDTDFALDDDFAFSIASGSGECVQLDSSNTDGSQHFYGVLSEDVDATGGAVVSVAFVQGEFNATALGFADGDAYTDFADEAKAKNCIFRTNSAVPA